MKTWVKVIIALAVVILVIIGLFNHCSKGSIYGNPVERAEQIYQEDKEYLYEIIDFVNGSGVTEIYTDEKDEKYYRRIHNSYVDIEGSANLTEFQEDKIFKISEFMNKKMIDAIQKYHDKNGYPIISFTIRHGSNSIAILKYCPHNPDIQEIKNANYCNGWYIDESWIVLDYQDEDY